MNHAGRILNDYREISKQPGFSFLIYFTPDIYKEIYSNRLAC